MFLLAGRDGPGMGEDKLAKGLSISPELHDRAMAGVPRSVSDSQRLCELIELGLAAESAFEAVGLSTDRHRVELEQTLESAMREAYGE